MTVARVDQVGQKLFGAMHHTPEVDVDQPVQIGVVDLGDRAGVADPSVVDDGVDPTVLSSYVGGVITAENRPGGGAIFRVSLPIGAGPPGPGPETSMATPRPTLEARAT